MPSPGRAFEWRRPLERQSCYYLLYYLYLVKAVSHTKVARAVPEAPDSVHFLHTVCRRSIAYVLRPSSIVCAGVRSVFDCRLDVAGHRVAVVWALWSHPHVPIVEHLCAVCPYSEVTTAINAFTSHTNQQQSSQQQFACQSVA